jgi:hypothetical protein
VETENRRRRKDSGVASTVDIHTPVENSGNNASEHEKRDKAGRKPPGQFVSDELEEQTARFIEGVKGLAQRRRKRASEETSGPPPPGGGQRSRRL